MVSTAINSLGQWKTTATNDVDGIDNGVDSTFGIKHYKTSCAKKSEKGGKMM